MHLLSWHGTLLRCGGTDPDPLQAGLWPVRATATDLLVTVPEGGLVSPVGVATAPDEVLEPAGGGRKLYWRRRDLYLNCELINGRARFCRREPRFHETFLLLPPAQLAYLRALIGHDWRLPDGTLLHGASITLGPGFNLSLDGRRFDLCVSMLRAVDGRLELADDRTSLLLRAVTDRESREFCLRRRPIDAEPQAVVDGASFTAAAEAKLCLRGGEEFGYLPLTADRADRDWLHQRYWRGGHILLGAFRGEVTIARERDRAVLTSRGQEGVIAGPLGASNENGYLLTSVQGPSLPPYSREGDDVYIDADILAAAPHLPGSYVNICNGHLTNYYHWLIDGVLHLHMLRPYLPAGVKLLLPRTVPDLQTDPALAQAGIVDHLATLRAWGFDDLEVVLAPPPVVRVDEIFYVHAFTTLAIPARLLRAARAHVLARRTPRRGGLRLYMRRRGGRRVSNADEIEAIVLRHGFTIHEMEGMSPEAQIDLFKEADFVVAPHGAGLTNLLFCAPGTRVMEISPESAYQSCFAEMSDKLGLVHALLPCWTPGSSFMTDLRVDADKFQRLLAMLLSLHRGAA